MGKKKPAASEAPPQEQQQPQQQGNGGRQPPVFEARYGRIRAVVWRNEGKDGPWFSVTITRSYKDGESNWKQSSSFGRDDLLVVAEASRAVWHWITQQGSKPDGNGHTAEPQTTGDVPF